MACRVLLPFRRLCWAEATLSQHGINDDSVCYYARLLKVVMVGGRGAMGGVGVGIQKQEQEQERAWVWTESGRSNQGR